MKVVVVEPEELSFLLVMVEDPEAQSYLFIWSRKAKIFSIDYFSLYFVFHYKGIGILIRFRHVKGHRICDIRVFN